MQNPEEDKLKRLLQDTFSDYEPEPSEQTWEYIDASIHPHQPFSANLFKRLAIAAIALLLLLSTGVIFMLEQKSTNFAHQLTLLEKNKEHIQEIKSHLAVEKENDTNKKEGQNNLESTEKNILNTENSTALKGQKNALAQHSNQAKHRTFKGHEQSDLSPVLQLSESSEIPNHYTNKNHSPASINVPENGLKMDKFEFMESKNILVNQPKIEWPIIEKFTVLKSQKPLIKSTYLSVSFTPLQTYRILKIDNPDIVSLQRNKLLDPERNGFEATIGITKSINSSWNFRGGISFLKMRQWAEYKVSTDKYLVKNNNQGTIEQITQNKVESENLEMIGLHADIQRLLRISGRNRYFVSTGTDMMYNSSNSRLNTFLQVSGGIQHAINTQCFLTIEPTASYMLNNINHSSNLIQTSAYNLGIKLGLSYKIQ
ncbi:hypothetical protein ACWA1C_11600 [Flectobacillus roseus]